MKKLVRIILIMLLVLLLVACGRDSETTGSDVSDSDFKTSEETPETESQTSEDTPEMESYDNVPGTNVPIYPNSEEVYKNTDTIVYITNDTAKSVNDFYKNHPQLKEFRSSKEDWYTYTTPLSDMLLEDASNWSDEKKAEISAYMEESGGLQGITI
ncbi:MAG: hypothetical protein GX046_09980 [Tissierellia bacterium]|nr:hypothetical protein [Tissierellia bacterium]